MITSAHSKSSNCSGFNPILQKFYQMISKIIVSKTVYKIFLIFCQSSFINNFIVKNNFLEPKNHQKLNIWRSIYFYKISAHRFVGLTSTDKLKEFFFQKIFLSRTWSFSHDCKTRAFILQKIKFIIFFKDDYLYNFNIKTCFKFYLEKLRKNGGFTLLNKLLQAGPTSYLKSVWGGTSLVLGL